MQKESRITFIIDVGNPVCDGKLFDREFLNNISHTLLPIHDLATHLSSLGITCITPDVFLDSPKDFSDTTTLLMSHLTSDRTAAMIDKGGVPFLLTCQESPFIATRFYVYFRSISGLFHNTMAFTGLEQRAHPKTRFHVMHFPIHIKDDWIYTPTPFNEKKEVVLVANNKSARNWKHLPLTWLYGRQVQLLYPMRKHVVTKLAADKKIDLYGGGWETDPSIVVREAHKGSAPGDTKYSIMNKYKFALCFENATFPGYITEKIFDAFLAGCIPIYLGAPDVSKFVPPETFIDMRKFSDMTSLYDYINHMSEEEYDEYLKSGKRFLTSNRFRLFSHESFKEKVTTLIQQYAERS